MRNGSAPAFIVPAAIRFPLPLRPAMTKAFLLLSAVAGAQGPGLP